MKQRITISDLSVGDWVSDKSGNCAKILGIENWSDGYMINIQRCGINVGVVPFVSAHPIPLTPEILDKNGFVKRETYIWNNPKVRCTAYRFGRKYLDIRVTYRARDYRPTRINIENMLYVHELQHALRMAGVEKEIEL